MNYRWNGWCITMNCYELLLDECEKNNITVVEKKFKSKAKGLWKNGKIGISLGISTTAERNCILAEEYGHYKTTVGDITDLSDIRNLKQENVARAVAIKKLCSPDKIIEAIKAGSVDRYEIAEKLNITDDFFDDAIAYYSRKNGYYESNGILIYFDNGLYVTRKDLYIINKGADFHG